MAGFFGDIKLTGSLLGYCVTNQYISRKISEIYCRVSKLTEGTEPVCRTCLSSSGFLKAEEVNFVVGTSNTL